MRVGGPPPRDASPTSDDRMAQDDRSRIEQSDSSTYDDWVATHWPSVRVCDVGAFVDLQDEVARPRVHAIVRLGALSPADVRVLARGVTTDAGHTMRAPLRLWSVQSYRNGAF